MNSRKVQFNEPEYKVSKMKASYGLFIDFLIKRGLVKNKQQATYVLLGIIVISIVIVFWLFPRNNSGAVIPKNADIIYSSHAPPRLAQPQK